MYTYFAQGAPAKLNGAATVAGVNAATRSSRDVWGGVTIGAHRVNWETGGPPIAAPAYAPNDAVATATAKQTGLGVYVDRAYDLAAGEFVVVSGLTYCWGLVAGRWLRGANTAAVVAHFNGDYTNATAWTKIRNTLAAGEGTAGAVVVLTSDSTRFDYDHYLPEFLDELIAAGVSHAEILIYWSNTSGVQFVMGADGSVGEYYARDYL